MFSAVYFAQDSIWRHVLSGYLAQPPVIISHLGAFRFSEKHGGFASLQRQNGE
jgi:hypothetical protein